MHGQSGLRYMYLRAPVHVRGGLQMAGCVTQGLLELHLLAYVQR